jgi:hypothetical protein
MDRAEIIEKLVEGGARRDEAAPYADAFYSIARPTRISAATVISSVTSAR